MGVCAGRERALCRLARPFCAFSLGRIRPVSVSRYRRWSGMVRCVFVDKSAFLAVRRAKLAAPLRYVRRYGVFDHEVAVMQRSVGVLRAGDRGRRLVAPCQFALIGKQTRVVSRGLCSLMKEHPARTIRQIRVLSKLPVA